MNNSHDIELIQYSRKNNFYIYPEVVKHEKSWQVLETIKN